MGLFRLLLPVAICAVSLAGCTGGSDLPKTGAVTGTVTLDGQPAAKCSVTFESDSGQVAFGQTDDAGRYELQFRDGVRGAVVGSNKVRIETTLEAPAPAGYKDPIPAKYNTQTTLQVNVQAGENTHNFDLESK